MKKMLVFLLLVVMLHGCVQQEKVVDDGAEADEFNIQEPPELVVRSNQNEVVAVLGTYSWSYDNGDGTSTGIEADSDIPPEIVAYQTTRFNTELGSEAELDFAIPPQDVRVVIWDDSKEVREVDMEGSTFTVDEQGSIVYEIYATWYQGSGHYALEVNVR